jgi:anti-sigma factor RsiW
VIGHLGPRVSALLDGQLSAKDTEEAWAHVYSCHACRDLVEREGWIKTRLAGLCADPGRGAPSDLKGSLLSMPPGVPPGEALLADAGQHPAARRTTGVVMIGGSAIGAAMLGVLALGFGGASQPADRRPPVTQINVNSTVPASPSPSPRVPAGSTPAPADVSRGVSVPVRRMLP